MLTQRRRKKSIINELFGGSMFGEAETFFDDFPESGYSISVVQTSEGTKVRAKVGKDADVNTLKNSFNGNIQMQK